jgi:sulfite reductase (ferredoxin)
MEGLFNLISKEEKMSKIQFPENISKAAKRDIVELEQKVKEFKSGAIPEDKFKHFRLTRGVYGQRQTGVQMIRIKLPYGKVTAEQLIAIANVSDKFATGNLHLTTRQDIQLHYVKVDNAPQLWADLEAESVTLREACGNTVRNVTASAIAGVDPDEPFDVTPYAHELAHYFLRNPICQDMGRKFKIAFSSSEKDTAFTFLHDIGFIPRIQNNQRGFKIVVGGGLGAQAIAAQTVYEFLEAEKIIPFTEGVLRVFDRHGERERRNKARFKFLVKALGLEEVMRLVEAEVKALKNKEYHVNPDVIAYAVNEQKNIAPAVEISSADKTHYENWLATNVFEQKQKGWFSIFLRVTTGDIKSNEARQLAALVQQYAADDMRITMNQGMMLKYVLKENLSYFFIELNKLGLAKPGFDSIHDVTTCPGTDTCNLGVTNSMDLARVLEDVLKDEFADLINESDIKIKMSGCMNACGQHMAANIGFSGSSIRVGAMVAPAMQVVMGGGVEPDGSGSIADKVVKIPTKKIPEVLRIVLNDYEENASDGEYFNQYYRRQGEKYFYSKLKPLADVANFTQDDYVDWGHNETYVQEIGVGECAGIILDVIGTVIKESEEKLFWAKEGLDEAAYADAIYNSYSSMVIGAKALLLSIDKQCNTQAGIIRDFNEQFYKTGKIQLRLDAENYILQINQNEPTKEFAEKYFSDANVFLEGVKTLREEQINADKTQENKPIIDSHYKA